MLEQSRRRAIQRPELFAHRFELFERHRGKRLIQRFLQRKAQGLRRLAHAAIENFAARLQPDGIGFGRLLVVRDFHHDLTGFPRPRKKPNLQLGIDAGRPPALPVWPGKNPPTPFGLLLLFRGGAIVSFEHLGGRLVELGELCLKFNQEFLPRPNDGAGGVEQLVIEQFAVIPCSLIAASARLRNSDSSSPIGPVG